MTRRGLMYFVLLSVLWGVPYLMIKVAVAEVSVPFLVFARAAIGALVLLPFAFLVGGFGWVRTKWLPLVGFCLTEMIAPWVLIAHGEVHIDSSTAGMLIALTPALTVVLSKLLGSGEGFDIRRSSGLSLGFFGVCLLAAPTLGGDLLSVIEIVLASVCYAIGSIIASRWLNDVPAAQLTGLCLIGAAVVFAWPAIQNWPVLPPSNTAIASILALGVFCTALAFAMFFLLVREVGPQRAVVITYVAPAIAVAAGVGLLGEPLNGGTLVAFAFILCGSWLSTSGGRTKPSPTSAATTN
jgi:drug/metabolite transporter (DMT)-like permease